MANGTLFIEDYLREGITDQPLWQSVKDEALQQKQAALQKIFDAFPTGKTPTESETEDELIWQVLEALGWKHSLRQQVLAKVGRSDVPDGLLFADAESKSRAFESPSWTRFRDGLCIVESKRWKRPLDREDKTAAKGDEIAPSTQMLRYLRRAEDLTAGGVRWGILTNGRLWRLYWQGARARSEDFFEIDLAETLGVPGCESDLFSTGLGDAGHRLKLFLLLFGRDAFIARDAGRTFHDEVLSQGRYWEERVTGALSDTVFGIVFPELAQALAAERKPGEPLSPGFLDEVREAALILLYRLLFILYAEDRNLLPDETGPYRDYALTRMRLDIARDRERGRVFDDCATGLWSRLKDIFRFIGEGSNRLGIPPYNGGLFAREAAPLLERASLSDAVLAEIIFRLSHQNGGETPRYINYRDLSVQQLGSIYERILEYELVADGGTVSIRLNPYARKGSGSYYTPEDLVRLVIEKTVGPLADERIAAFDAKAMALASDRRPKAQRLEELQGLDPATRILDLKICDPAMGSGHFLVSLVDWLADRVLAAMSDAVTTVAWSDEPYRSPLAARIEAIRGKILDEARAHNWPIVEEQLEDRHIVRRMILKRVIYGVDKNPMAVELAKLSLWLHTFTAGAPLSFLDHHLRCGDSLFGERVRGVMDALEKRSLLASNALARARATAVAMEKIENLTDADITEVKASAESWRDIQQRTAPLQALMDFLHALRWIGPASREQKAALTSFFDGQFGDAFDILMGKAGLAERRPEQVSLLPADGPDEPEPLLPEPRGDPERAALLRKMLDEARRLIRENRFLHWQVAFPGVWSNWESAEPQGGFDAVIGNPPYVRQELLGKDAKQVLKAAYDAYDGMADLYVYFYELGLRLLRPGGRLSYVVTNKWLKAGYAEALRDLFTTKTHVEFVADFGHAKHFFPDADVFPSVAVLRRPVPGESAPGETSVCVIPREAVPRKGLEEAVATATVSVPLAHFTKQSWTLEPPEVMALLNKITKNGVPLIKYADVRPYRGVLTGLNEAFLIDTPTRDRLVRDDPGCAKIIRPYLRGQDIERWWSPPTGLHMILLKSSGYESDTGDLTEGEAEERFANSYPSLYAHVKEWEEVVDPGTGKKRGLRHRQDQGRFWWELRSCSYYEAFEQPKIIYQELSWWQTFQRDEMNLYFPNTAYLLTSADPWLLTVLNAPTFWWWSWRRAIHGKDEALRLIKEFIVTFPITKTSEDAQSDAAISTDRLKLRTRDIAASGQTIHDWLRHEFGLSKFGRALAEPHKLVDADGFVAAVKAAFPKTRNWSAAEIARLKQEHAATVVPARETAAEILALERKLSDLVNAAYKLTPEEIALMWRTAPPRMPLNPQDELRRLGFA